jgi:hypothetical protein
MLVPPFNAVSLYVNTRRQGACTFEPTYWRYTKDMIDSIELDALGLLRTTKVPNELDWMTDDEKLLLIRLLFCGEEGMHSREINRLRKTPTGADAVLRMEAYGLANWERDGNGRQTTFSLSWKGIESAQLVKKVAQNGNKKAAAERRNNG